MATTTPRYTYDDRLPDSPVALSDLSEIQTSLLWSDEDTEALRRAGEILAPRTEEILDVWYGFVGSTPHLVSAFADADGNPDSTYLEAVRPRFARWIVDLCTRDYDETWLAYQNEIALRHHPEKKNITDEIDSAAPYIQLRHLIALAVPITVTIRDFLREGEDDEDAIDAMYHAWFKGVMLSVVLWARPYSPDLW